MNACPALWALPLLALLSACDRPQPMEAKEVLRPVRVLTLQTSEQQRWREFPGVVKAAREAELGFRVAGKLEKMLVGEGDDVKEGQLLAQLDATDYRIQLNARQAEYDKARADFQRAESLSQKNLISRADLDKLRAQHESARAALEAARQSVDYTRLTAVFDGEIAQRHVENFEEVSASQTVYTLQDMSEIHITVDIPESVMIRAREGARPNIEARFDQIPGQSFPLDIREVATQAAPDTNTFRVTLSMPPVAEHNILPGMSVTVRGEPPQDRQPSHSSLYIPAHAALEDEQGRYVFLAVRQQNQQALVERRDITTGELTSLGLEVVAGLKPGEQLITAGMSKMFPGLRVIILPESND